MELQVHVKTRMNVLNPEFAVEMESASIQIKAITVFVTEDSFRLKIEKYALVMLIKLISRSRL